MDAHVREPSMRGAISGQVAVGRYVVHIGQPYGALICEGPRAQRTHTRPRPRPILLGPRLIRGLFGRQAELAALLSALDAGVPVEISGEPGIGKTAVLRYLAHHPRAASFVDGIVYLPARHQSSADLQQQIFEAFYDSDEICKPTEAEIRRGLQEKRALILLDDVHLGLNELEQVLDIAPRSAFVVVTRERRLWGEVRSLTLTGLPSADAVLLLERELERPLDITERSAALGLCAAIGGTPSSNPASRRHLPRTCDFPRRVGQQHCTGESHYGVDGIDRREAAARPAGVGRAAWPAATRSARGGYRGTSRTSSRR